MEIVVLKADDQKEGDTRVTVGVLLDM